jgi:FkbM family methyltransferase
MMFLKIKRLIVIIITNPIIGFLISFFYKDKINFQGTLIDLKTLSYKNLASLHFNLYESKEILMVKNYLSTNNNVIELGSSIGIVSSQILKKNNGKKIFVEANPVIINQLRKNIELNSNHSNYCIENYVINHENKPMYFSISKDNLIGKMSDDIQDNSIKVDGINLSSLIQKHNFEDYSLVMDIEGAELELIKFNDGAFKKCSEIIAEFHDTKQYSYQEIINMYVDYGFAIKYQYFNRVVLTKN